MIYIVSGYYRSGTSAMMQSLIAGGMEASWSEERNKVADIYADECYHPNKNGLFEIPLREYNEVGFPLKYQNKLIKVMIWGLNQLSINPEGYKIIIMKRDPEEIRQSYEGFFGEKLPILTKYYEIIEQSKIILTKRSDVLGITVLDYSELVANPKSKLLQLHEEGWPINYLESAVVIKPDLYRFRKELLTVGI